ncbi:peroxiredoxin-like family protein [Sphingomonas sp. 22R3R2A-7]|uniref:peroxiredoxin-like family protein n=1 Tax=Sphingomonas sp. 22R3R2A-7 TaxID=3050230 RepID=UPI002FE1CC79
MTHVRTLPNPGANANDDADGWTELYDRVVPALKRHGVADGSPQVGEPFPDFSLPDMTGRYRSLRSICADGTVVVSFQRGLWCPYCSHELATWAEALPSLHEAGIKLVIVAGEVADRAITLQQLVGDNAIMLCDVDHGAALATGLAFHVADEMKRRYRAAGLDLGVIYGSDGWFLPVPATYVIDAGGIVRYAHADADFRVRADPHDVAAIAVALP